MAGDPAVPFIEVKIEGVNLTPNIRRVEVEDNDRLIDKATVTFDDERGQVVDLPSEGQLLKITMGWQEERAVLFEGAVVRAPVDASPARGQSVTVVAYDPSFKMMQSNSDNPEPLTHNPKTRAHPGKVSEILERIIAPYQIPKGIIKLDTDPTFTDAQPLRQVNLTDWQFIQDLAHAYGARAYVEHNDNASKFYFQPETTLLAGDPMGHLKYCRGFSQLVEFRYQRAAGGAAAQRTVMGIDPNTGQPVTSPPTPPPAPEPPTRPNPSTRANLATLGGGTADRYEQAFDAVAQATATPASQRPLAPLRGTPSDPSLPGRISRPDPTRIVGLLGNGVATGTVNLRAKGKVNIEGVAVWAEGDWYVHKAVHIYTRVMQGERDRSTYETRFVATR